MALDVSDAEEKRREEARRWIARMASGDMTADELAAFKNWRSADPEHDGAFEEQRALWRAIGSVEAVSQVPTRRSRGLWLAGERQAKRHLPKVTGLAVAALAALWMGPDIMLMLRADHRTDLAVRTIGLPDGSTAALDARSAIAVHYDGHERRVELLRGDIWVRVAHGDRRPFRVAALGGETQDIGTAFEVHRSGERVVVSVTQGSVRVRAGDQGPSMMLRASDRAYYERGGEAITHLTAIAPNDMAAWRNGELLLHKASVQDALDSIGRYRSGATFLLGAIPQDRRISAVFRTDRPEEALDAVAHMAQLNIYRLGNIVLLRPAK